MPWGTEAHSGHYYSLVRPGGTAVSTNYVADVEALRAAGITGINFALPASSELFERVADTVADARRYVDDFPLSKAGFLEWDLIAVGAPLPLEYVFDSAIDIGEPYDRTRNTVSSQ